jgi:hypothetical protein
MTVQWLDLYGSPSDDDLGPKPTRLGPFQALRHKLFGTEYEVRRFDSYTDGGIWVSGWRWVRAMDDLQEAAR